MESRRNNRAVATATSHGVLPLDVVFDVLVCLPAKEICRLRAVSQPWRSLTSDPAFIKAHAARHPGPLIVAQRPRKGKRDLVHVMDLSGCVMKQVPIPRGQTLMCSHLDLICVGDFDTSRSCYLIDPATVAACRLDVNCFRERLCSDHDDECLDPAISLFALGRVDSTGEYKVLMVSRFTYAELNEDQQSCHVLTVNGAGGGTRWRSTASPEFLIEMDTMNRGVVVGGAVYYLADDSEFHTQALKTDNAPDLIASFDFETEHWSAIPVPLLVDDGNGNHDDVSNVEAKLDEYIDMLRKSALAELKGYLVLAHSNCRYSSSLDLWFLKDIENRLWVKEYCIQDPGPAIQIYQMTVKPLLLLDDGRIVFFLGCDGTLLLYDPMTKLFSQMGKGVRQVALYKGSLLAECLGIQSMVAGV